MVASVALAATHSVPSSRHDDEHVSGPASCCAEAVARAGGGEAREEAQQSVV